MRSFLLTLFIMARATPTRSSPLFLRFPEAEKSHKNCSGFQIRWNSVIPLACSMFWFFRVFYKVIINLPAEVSSPWSEEWSEIFSDRFRKVQEKWLGLSQEFSTFFHEQNIYCLFMRSDAVQNGLNDRRNIKFRLAIRLAIRTQSTFKPAT